MKNLLSWQEEASWQSALFYIPGESSSSSSTTQQARQPACIPSDRREEEEGAGGGEPEKVHREEGIEEGKGGAGTAYA